MSKGNKKESPATCYDILFPEVEELITKYVTQQVIPKIQKGLAKGDLEVTEQDLIDMIPDLKDKARVVESKGFGGKAAPAFGGKGGKQGFGSSFGGKGEMKPTQDKSIYAAEDFNDNFDADCCLRYTNRGNNKYRHCGSDGFPVCQPCYKTTGGQELYELADHYINGKGMSAEEFSDKIRQECTEKRLTYANSGPGKKKGFNNPLPNYISNAKGGNAKNNGGFGNKKPLEKIGQSGDKKGAASKEGAKYNGRVYKCKVSGYDDRDLYFLTDYNLVAYKSTVEGKSRMVAIGASDGPKEEIRKPTEEEVEKVKSETEIRFEGKYFEDFETKNKKKKKPAKDDSESEEDEKPAKKTFKKKPVKEESESEEEEKPVKKTFKKKPAKEESESEEEKPVKKNSKKPAKDDSESEEEEKTKKKPAKEDSESEEEEKPVKKNSKKPAKEDSESEKEEKPKPSDVKTSSLKRGKTSSSASSIQDEAIEKESKKKSNGNAKSGLKEATSLKNSATSSPVEEPIGDVDDIGELEDDEE